MLCVAHFTRQAGSTGNLQRAKVTSSVHFCQGYNRSNQPTSCDQNAAKQGAPVAVAISWTSSRVSGHVRASDPRTTTKHRGPTPKSRKRAIASQARRQDQRALPRNSSRLTSCMQRPWTAQFPSESAGIDRASKL